MRLIVLWYGTCGGFRWSVIVGVGRAQKHTCVYSPWHHVCSGEVCASPGRTELAVALLLPSPYSGYQRPQSKVPAAGEHCCRLG